MAPRENMTEESTQTPHRQPLNVLPDPQQEAAIKAMADAQAAQAARAAEPKPVENPSGKILTPLEKKLLEGQVIKAVRQIYDPEIPVNIYELGLIYSIVVDDTAGVTVQMTLTAPACPVAGSLPGEVEKRIEAIPDVRSATVDLVWEPAWSKDRMSELARLTLDMM
jgi:FeS assembly SUF system protein